MDDRILGGVGGTLTIICYGYWIREEGRLGLQDLKICRIDLASGYLMTGFFAIGMVVIGSRIQLNSNDGGARLVIELANSIEASLGRIGPAVKSAFLP